jgi:hypothetical protein
LLCNKWIMSSDNFQKKISKKIKNPGPNPVFRKQIKQI